MAVYQIILRDPSIYSPGTTYHIEMGDYALPTLTNRHPKSESVGNSRSTQIKFHLLGNGSQVDITSVIIEADIALGDGASLLTIYEDGSGALFGWTVELLQVGDDIQATLTPPATLAPNQYMFFRVHASNLAGDVLVDNSGVGAPPPPPQTANQNPWRWKTGPSTGSPPYIKALQPASETTSVGPNVPIVITLGDLDNQIEPLSIEVEVDAISGDGSLLGALRVYDADRVPANLPGWSTGVVSGIGTAVITVTPPAPWTPGSYVFVRVRAEDTTGLQLPVDDTGSPPATPPPENPNRNPYRFQIVDYGVDDDDDPTLLTPPYLDNHAPASEATGVVPDTGIDVDIVDDDNRVDPSTVKVWVDSTSGDGTAFELAYDATAAGLTNGYTGTVTQVGNNVEIRLTPPADFERLQWIFVKVQALDVTGIALPIAGAPPDDFPTVGLNPYRFQIASGPYLVDIVPPQEATGVAVAANIHFEIHDNTDPIDAATLVIEADLATGDGSGLATIYDDAGGWAVGWAGTLTPSGNNLIVDITTHPAFATTRWIFWRVGVDDDGGLSLLVNGAVPPPANVEDNPWRFQTAGSSGTAPFLAALSPASEATGVAPDATIDFEIRDTSNAVALASIVIEVDVESGDGSALETIYTGGAYVAPWSGNALALVGNNVPVSLTPPGPLEPGRRIYVRVAAQDATAIPLPVDDASDPPAAAGFPHPNLNPYRFTIGEAPYLVDHEPDPEEAGVLRTAPVVVTVTDPDNTVEVTSITIDVDITSGDGSAFEQIYDDAGGFVAGYTGTVAQNGDDVDIDFASEAEWPAGMAIFVRVRGEDATAIAILEGSLIPPNPEANPYRFFTLPAPVPGNDPDDPPDPPPPDDDEPPPPDVPLQPPPFLAALNPASEATGVAPATNPYFEIRDLDDVVDIDSVEVWADRTSGTGAELELIYDLDGFKLGWTGAVVQNGNNNNIEIDLTPPIAFPAGLYVFLRAAAQDEAGNDLIIDDAAIPPTGSFPLAHTNPWRFRIAVAGITVTPPGTPPGVPPTGDPVPPGDPAAPLDATVQNDGGYRLRFAGLDALSITDGMWRVHVGPEGDETDPKAWSGVIPVAERGRTIGRGEAIRVLEGACELVTPPGETGGPYALTFVSLDDGTTIVTPPLVTYVDHHYRSRTESLRRRWNPVIDVGFRRPSKDRYPQG